MKSMPTPTEQNSHTGQGAGRLTQPVRLAVIDMSSFIECLPADVRKKLSLYDIKRVCDNYRKRPCGECHLKPGETCDICGAVEKPNAPKVCDTKNQKPKPMDTPQTETPENRTGCGSPDAACSAATPETDAMEAADAWQWDDMRPPAPYRRMAELCRQMEQERNSARRSMEYLEIWKAALEQPNEENSADLNRKS